MKALEERRTLVKAARMYYEEELTQAEIAERLRLSRQKVQRVLSQAREEGVVRITINPILGVFSDLERDLEARYHLVEAIVVETTAHDNPGTVAREVGAAAAEYLLRVVRPRDSIALSWGNTLLGMVNAMPFSPLPHLEGVRIIQCVGGLGDPNNETHATQLLKRAARALNAQSVLLPAPAVAGTVAAREALCSDPQVAQVLALARSADLAFFGVGSPHPDAIMVPELWNVVSRREVDDVVERGAAASLIMRFLDARGQEVPSRLKDCVIGLSMDEIRKLPRVVCLGGGATKLEAVRAVLNGGYAHVLVTDHVTAQKMLD